MDDRGSVVALAIKAAIAPLQAEIAVLKALLPDVGALRERIAVAEARPPVPGPPGLAGADGVGIDELTVEQDPADARIVTLGYRRGDVTKTIGTLRFAIPRYCGDWDQTRSYTPGDQVRFNSSLWICDATTRNRPGAPDDGWTLQVKRPEK